MKPVRKVFVGEEGGEVRQGRQSESAAVCVAGVNQACNVVSSDQRRFFRTS